MNGRDYKIILMNDLYPPYWDEGGISFHQSRGQKNKYKRITRFEYRMYRTWKYNRKTKWK